jgi:flagellar biosynthetic protein FlhB
MADKPAAEQTEQPTKKRLDKAHEKGQVPQSQEFNSLATLLFLTATAFFLSTRVINWITLQMQQGLAPDISVFNSTQSFISFAAAKLQGLMLITFPFFAALAIGAIIAGIVVSGLNFSPGALELKLDAISPAKGIKKLFNTKSLVLLVMSIAKLILISLVVWFYVKKHLLEFSNLRYNEIDQTLQMILKLISGLMVRVCITLLFLSLIDVVYQKWKFIDELKMTKQEVKEENKETEGSPEVKSRIRKLQFQMAAKRMMQEVPKANVIIVNPTHVAVALKYDPKTMESPIVVAKGVDNLAAKIREIARAYGVPIIRRPELARSINSTVKTGQSIPQDLYAAVAEILALIYRMKNRR